MMEKAAASMAIEVTVISAEGLTVGRNRSVKRDAFVVVRSDPFNSRATGMDRAGGGYPAWNEKLVMELPGTARFLTVEAHSGSRLVGTTSVPVSDFAGGFLPANYSSFLSYRLRDANGEKNGIVNLSVKVKGGAAACPSRVSVADHKVAAGQQIVTGIPVFYTF